MKGLKVSRRAKKLERQKQMLALYEQGLGYAAIADRVGVSKEWVRECLGRGRPNQHSLLCKACGAEIRSPVANGRQGPVLCRKCALNNPNLEFRELLRGLRVSAGLTQDALAQAAGTSGTRIALIELGRVPPRWEEGLQLLAILGAAWVLKDSESSQPRQLAREPSRQ
jgi:DNA-binding XRE family transcriptional regulator